MKARPILMSAPMVIALLEGRKTQTRRIVKPQPEIKNGFVYLPKFNAGFHPDYLSGKLPRERVGPPLIRTPYGLPGDLLWVRESFAYFAYEGKKDPLYKATSEPDAATSWKPSIHMPRIVSRLTLEITGVRVEKLQDISPHDASAEGIFTPEIGYANLGEKAPVIQYGRLWEEINGQGAWDANPWVWALSFNVHHKNIDAFLKERVAA